MSCKHSNESVLPVVLLPKCNGQLFCGRVYFDPDFFIPFLRSWNTSRISSFSSQAFQAENWPSATKAEVLARFSSEFARVLRPGSLLMFTTFGMDTLQNLRQAWAQVHVNRFVDMYDIGDALLAADARRD